MELIHSTRKHKIPSGKSNGSDIFGGISETVVYLSSLSLFYIHWTRLKFQKLSAKNFLKRKGLIYLR